MNISLNVRRCAAVPRKSWAGRLRRPAHDFLLPCQQVFMGEGGTAAAVPWVTEVQRAPLRGSPKDELGRAPPAPGPTQTSSLARGAQVRSPRQVFTGGDPKGHKHLAGLRPHPEKSLGGSA